MEYDKSEVDFQRAQEAIRRGWIKPEQVSECLRERNTAQSLLQALASRGWLSPSQVQRLMDVTVRIQPGPKPAQQDDDADVLRSGDLISDRYLIKESFRGGFGRVYLCTAVDSGRRVAIKTLLRKHLLSEEAVRMFHDEALKWIRLGSHPNIVLAFGLEDFMRLPFIVMECIEGGRSLRDALKKGTTWKDALDYGAQVADGLRHAGRVCGLVHRDLKPENILLAPDGTAKVTDFGLSLVQGRVEDGFAGTPPYASPEQWSDPTAVDVRSDVYAFGVMLYELAAGQRPFPNHRTLEEFAMDHLYTAPADPRSLRPEIPEALAKLILKCLEKKPDRRPSDFGALSKELCAQLGRPPFVSPRSFTVGMVDGLVNQAKTYLNLRKMDEALRTAQEAAGIDPDHANAQIILANVLGELRRLPEALQCLERALRIEPRNPVAIVNAAAYSHMAGLREEAGRRLDDALRLVPVIFLERLLQILVEVGRLDEAISIGDQILGKNPHSVVSLNAQAIAHRRKGDLPQALACADRAVDLNPRYSIGWSNRATILVQMGRLDGAIESADRAIELEPATAGAYAAKAAALGSLGRIEESRACLLEGLRVIPNHPGLVRALQQIQ